VYGLLGNRRIPLPCCAFPTEKEDLTGYIDEN
jgi:hypothetical protein